MVIRTHAITLVNRILPINNTKPYHASTLFEKLDVKNAKELKVEDIKRLLPRIDVGYDFVIEGDNLMEIVHLVKSLGSVEKAKKETLDTYEFDKVVMYFN